jgi:NRAMP (natural resistance-associated macrophage protein)-like metal ion transporter
MKLVNKIKKIWKSLGSGLITGASDNDPSAIITYSTAGAKLGLGSIWILLYILPIMIVMQEMSARIGLSSSCGLAGNIKRHYSKKILIFISTLLITANTLNIGADIYGMTSAIEIFIPQKIHLLSWLTIILILILIIALPYKKIVKIFKWLSFCLFTYVLAGLIVIDNWAEILKNIFVPNITFTKEGILIMVAILGTTLSPYLAFWQASEEAEEKKIKYNYDNEAPKCEYRIVTKNELKKITIDTRIGMFFSNFISFFIISLTSSVFFNAGINNISTIKDAAEALKPLVGDFSYFLFSMGIISSGLLAIPILAGSSAYVMSEIFNWPGSLNHPFNKAREFYFVIIISTLFGIIMPYLGISAVKSLILIATILHMANNPKIVGPNVNKKITNIIGYLTLIILILALILLFIANTSLF